MGTQCYSLLSLEEVTSIEEVAIKFKDINRYG